MTPLLASIIGGLIAGLFAILGLYLSAGSRKRIRMDEIMAEKKIEADAIAYKDAKWLESMLVRDFACRPIIAAMEARQDWFFLNRLFLPGKYPARWLLVRNKLISFCKSQTPSDPELRASPELKEELLKLITSAIDEIYADIRLGRIVLDDPELDTDRRSY